MVLRFSSVFRTASLLVLVLVALPVSQASLKHPIHGRNQRARPVQRDPYYEQLDNTDAFRDNVVPVVYRKSTAKKLKEAKAKLEVRACVQKSMGVVGV